MKLKDIARVVASSHSLTLYQQEIEETGQVLRQWVCGNGATYALPDDLPKLTTGDELLAMLEANWREVDDVGTVTIIKRNAPAFVDNDDRDQAAEKMNVGFSFLGSGYQAFRIGEEVRLIWPSLIKPTDDLIERSWWKRGECMIVKDGMMAVAAIGFAAPWERNDGEKLISDMEELTAMLGLRYMEYAKEGNKA